MKKALSRKFSHIHDIHKTNYSQALSLEDFDHKSNLMNQSNLCACHHLLAAVHLLRNASMNLGGGGGVGGAGGSGALGGDKSQIWKI